MNIEVQGVKLVGFERFASEIRLQINLEDASRCTVRLSSPLVATINFAEFDFYNRDLFIKNEISRNSAVLAHI